jgi:hypothetical protein
MKRTENIRPHIGETITIRWGTSRGQNSYGYTTCSLRNDRGQKIAACNGGGYDLKGTVLGDWIAKTFAKELMALRLEEMPKEHSLGRQGFYGLTYHNPNFNPGKAVIGKDCDDRTMGGSEGQTVEQAEAAGKSMGLDRYQAFYCDSSPIPTKVHTIPLIDGAVGESSVLRILNALGLSLRRVRNSSKLDVYAIEAFKRD